MKKLGYIQNKIVEIGKEKGFVTSVDLFRFYQSSKTEMEMNKLIALELFEEAEDCGTLIKWKFIGGK